MVTELTDVGGTTRQTALNVTIDLLDLEGEREKAEE